jgi:HKD family nuclease
MMMVSRKRMPAMLATGMLLASTLFAAGSAYPDQAAADVGALVSSARATIADRPVWAHFSNPRLGRDYTIINELRRLIQKTPQGARIRGAIHSISIDSVASDLVNAKNRGVDVRVVIDGKNEPSDAAAVGLLRRLTHRFCTNDNGGNGCISTSPDGDMHTKMFTFSRTTDPNGTAHNNVSWFGSSNLTYTTGPDAFNNAVTVYGAESLMDGLNANFDDMFARRHYASNDYYDSASGRGYYLALPSDVYASPEASGQTDTIATRLDDVTPDANCRLRIGMANVTSGRPKLVEQIKRYRQGGCWVWMVVGGNATDGISMSQTVYDDLLRAGVKIRRIDHVHDKYFALYGKFSDSYHYRVYTGSQNWTQDALNENDEIFVKMGWETGTTHPLYEGFANHFKDAYNYGTTCTAANYPCV